MTHFAREKNDAGYYRGYAGAGNALATVIRNIDEKTFKSINGDEGGTWSPSAQITIGGAGVVIAGPWSMSAAGVTVTTTTDYRITFGKGDAEDYFGYVAGHAGASPSVFVDFAESDCALAKQVYWTTVGLLTRVLGARFAVRLPVYSGAAQLGAVVVSFAVGEAHAAIPQVLPRLRVIAVAADGTVTPLRALDATTDADGFQWVPTPASGAAWYAAGAAKSWTYTCNVELPTDAGVYECFMEIIDESGTDAWVTVANTYRSVTIAHSGVALFDGRN